MDFPLFLVILQDNLSVFLQTVVLFFFYLTFQSFGLIILFYRLLVIHFLLTVFRLSHGRNFLS